MQILPFQPLIPFYQFGTTLEDREYSFKVRWNDRDVAWYFDIFDEGEVAIVHGVKVVLGALLGGNNPSANRLPGILVASDLFGEGVEATFEDLGDRVNVYYVPISELDTF